MTQSRRGTYESERKMMMRGMISSRHGNTDHGASTLTLTLQKKRNMIVTAVS